MVIHRNITRTILNSTESTYQTQTPSSAALTFELAMGVDSFYVGFREKFQSRYIHLGTANTNPSSLSIKYWNGTAFTDVTDPIDQTLGFTQSGFISWTNEPDWQKSTQAPVTEELYWIEITVTADLSIGTTLQSLLNLFCDEGLVRAYYPELILDARYLPSSSTDFTEQLVAAKDLVVTKLKQQGRIDDESQIIDVNEVSIAAVHAFAWVVRNPIAVSETDRELSDRSYNDFVRELTQIKFDIDQDNSGEIESWENNRVPIFIPRL